MEKEIEKRLSELEPWHFTMPIGNSKSTTDFNTRKMSLIDPYSIKKLFKLIYPEGRLDGKRFLDVGCNGGGYCFVANELGAEYVYGFDIRQHWIDQAKFLRDKVFKISSDKIKFNVDHLDKLSDKETFDFTLFKGVFYHIPDPILSMKILCGITKEIIVIDTAGSVDAPPNTMELYFENPNALMNGVDNLAWLPGGPEVVQNLLKWCGFTESRVIKQPEVYQPNGHARKMMRFRVIGARNPKSLRRFDRIMERRKQEQE